VPWLVALFSRKKRPLARFPATPWHHRHFPFLGIEAIWKCEYSVKGTIFGIGVYNVCRLLVQVMLSALVLAIEQLSLFGLHTTYRSVVS
jgi:hypothetical protein